MVSTPDPEQDVTDSGTGKMHIGWLVPDEKLCLGAGPALIRMSRDEAVDLAWRLHDLLNEEGPDRGPGPVPWTMCGCAPPDHDDSESKQYAAQFMSDAEFESVSAPPPYRQFGIRHDGARHGPHEAGRPEAG